MIVQPATPLVVHGDARSRGLAFAWAGEAHRGAVQARVHSVMKLLARTGSAEWVAAQRQAQRDLLPEIAAFVDGMADGYGVPSDALFAAHLRYAIEDRHDAPPIPDDGCSVFAVTRADGTTLLAKNRDNPVGLRSLQTLLRQSDPAWDGRQILCVGSFGSMPSASSGMNTDGLCVADTAVRTDDLGIGVLRYDLMEALLIRCGDVAQALAMITRLPHVGGGNLLLSDAGGTIAAVEIGHRRVAVTRPDGPRSMTRTNHVLDETLSASLRERPGCAARVHSESRLARLRQRIADASDWDIADCAALLSEHAEQAGGAPICRHDADTATMSGAIYDPGTRMLLLSVAQPCLGPWRRASLAA
ncbi:C45 family autoproteolytic acyltransferase/hydolase [Falsiroseomonas sp. HW251]|uniref:C45 family autoproteolytic acyltransferase/hydolase n=1 Tax=Falsiroseomonas sp. HW251 TaxID=3390998 RepID=UPI003D312605